MHVSELTTDGHIIYIWCLIALESAARYGLSVPYNCTGVCVSL